MSDPEERSSPCRGLAPTDQEPHLEAPETIVYLTACPPPLPPSRAHVVAPSVPGVDPSVPGHGEDCTDTEVQRVTGSSPGVFSSEAQTSQDPPKFQTQHSMDSRITFKGKNSLLEAKRSSASAEDMSSVEAHASRKSETESPDEPSLENKRPSQDSPMSFGLDPASAVEAEDSSSAADMVSLGRSHFSKGIYVDFADDNPQVQCDPKSGDSRDETSDVDSINSDLEHLEKAVLDFVSSELKWLVKSFTTDRFRVDREDREHLDEWKKPREAIQELVLHFLRRMDKNALADSFTKRFFGDSSQCQTKCKLRAKFQDISEGFEEIRQTTPLNEIYTELYLIEGETDVAVWHEATQIQTRQSRPIKSVRSADIFSPPRKESGVRTVLTKGVAGIGKTLLTQKFCLDWAEGITNHNIHCVFPFSFRELNQLRGDSISLYGLIGHFFTETERGVCRLEDFQCLLIFDGLEECRFELDFANAPSVTDAREKTTVEALLVNIIRGTLFPSAFIWITTRPAAASQIPEQCVTMVTEIKGFTDPQKELYFRKKFRDEEQVLKVLSHLKASPSVYNMCSIPVFGWITAQVMDNVLQTEEGQLPQTLTELYSLFLVLQAKITNAKYKGKSMADVPWSPGQKQTIMSLSKLAFEQLLRGNFIFYESDVTDCGVDVTEASVHSGLFSQMFKEERGLYKNKVFSFVHLSVQEFLAALHVHVTFMDSDVNLLAEKQSFWTILFSRKLFIRHFYRTAVDKALESTNGHLDLFLRFLLGLSLESNQSVIRGLLRRTGSQQTNKETRDYLKTKLESGLPIERSLTLLQCLNELKDSGLCDEVQAWLSSDKIPSDLSPAQWSALVCILLSRNDPKFDLTQYQQSETALLMLLPVVKRSSKALLSGCGLSDKACAALASELSSQCSLRDLDLSNNLLEDSGLRQLCEGLRSSSCALKTLSVRNCSLSSCEDLVPVLVSDSTVLMELDLSDNDLMDSGVQPLCSALRNPVCKLETLRLSGCQVSTAGCAPLVSALSSAGSCLKELDLSYNHPGATEADRLTALLLDSTKKLSLEHGGVERLKSGFRKYSCHLTFDLNTANQELKVSDEGRRIAVGREKLTSHDDLERFDYWMQVLCSEGLTGRRYWEVQVCGGVHIAVTYKSIKRRGNREDSSLGKNAQSWSLHCSEGKRFSVFHQNRRRSFENKKSDRIGVFLDWENGLLSFYEVSSEQTTHLHTIKTTFTEEVYPAFGIETKPVNSSVTLCPI